MSINSQDVGGWWSAFFNGGFNWRWFDSPSLYYRPKLRYCPQGKYATFDGMGRERVQDELFDATIDPETAEYVKLYVQAPADLCLAPNATWKRTVIRNVAPLFVRFANIPFSCVPDDRRHDFSKYTPEDWAAVAFMWIPSIVLLQLSMFILDYDQPAGKDPLMYLPLLYAYTTAQFDIREGTDDYEMLMALALTATGEYIESIQGAQRKPRAIWMAHSCIPIDRYLADDGTERWIDAQTPEGRIRQEKMMNDDTYSISDVLRGAERVIIIAGNPLRPSSRDPLKEWGERVWTLPEILLAKGDSVCVYYSLHDGNKLESVSKSNFATIAWKDAHQSRQLIEHFTNLHLSRLELMNIAVECLMSRSLNSLHAGDRVYALMGLLRIRPPIDSTDTSFQAFAR
ncbi:hypothetical protein ACJ41O_010445 [Fusarium nematophilum]